MRIQTARAVLRLIWLSGCASLLVAQEPTTPFIARTFTASNGTILPYRLFVPVSSTQGHSLPLIVYLHGGGGAGTDNIRQISGGNEAGTRLWLRPDLQARHPAFVVAPQAPVNEPWSAPDADSLAPFARGVVDLIRKLAQEFPIDTFRLYVVGQSRGGQGVWDLIIKRPNLFAAAVPLCGDGSLTRVTAARGVPVWAFHGAKDDVTPVTTARALVAALRAAGGVVRYTEYPDVGHQVWKQAFLDPELPNWLFTQRRVRR